ncbi:MAG TPA: NDP-sugar synthase [Actinophytocola sp.]|nr:NDP-sugar synthase [Actinophytocola sp.]
MTTVGVALAAGVGSRLAPLTDHTPKPLLPLLDRPLLVHLLEQLAGAGAEHLYVNLHHHAEQVAGVLDRTELPVDVTYRREPVLTGPAGALALFVDELTRADEILVVSGDVVLGEELPALLATHRRRGAELTFGVVRTTEARRFGVLDLDGDGRVVRAREKPDVPDHETHWISAGVYCLAPELVGWLVDELTRVPSLDYARHLAPDLLARGRAVFGHPLAGYWRDVGTPQAYRAANVDAAMGAVAGVRPRESSRHGAGIVVADTAVLGDDVRLTAPAVIGAGAVVGDRCQVADSVLLPGARLPADTFLVSGLLADALTEIPWTSSSSPRPSTR